MIETIQRPGTVCFWCLCEQNAGGEALHGRFLEDCDRHKTTEAVAREVFGLKPKEAKEGTNNFAGVLSSPAACASAAGSEASGLAVSLEGACVGVSREGAKGEKVGTGAEENLPIGTPIGEGLAGLQSGIVNGNPNATRGADNRRGRDGAAVIGTQAETAGETAAVAFKGAPREAMDQAAKPTDPGEDRCVAKPWEPFNAAAGEDYAGEQAIPEEWRPAV